MGDKESNEGSDAFGIFQGKSMCSTITEITGCSFKVSMILTDNNGSGSYPEQLVNLSVLDPTSTEVSVDVPLLTGQQLGHKVTVQRSDGGPG
jgi:hypothetical protein